MLVENLPDLAVLVEPLLIVRRVVREQLGILHRRLLAIVRDDDVCRRLMTVPGVGPVVALTYRVTVDVPARFRNSKAVGAGGANEAALHRLRKIANAILHLDTEKDEALPKLEPTQMEREILSLLRVLRALIEGAPSQWRSRQVPGG